MLNIYYDDMTYAKLVEFEKFKFIGNIFDPIQLTPSFNLNLFIK